MHGSNLGLCDAYTTSGARSASVLLVPRLMKLADYEVAAKIPSGRAQLPTIYLASTTRSNRDSRRCIIRHRRHSPVPSLYTLSYPLLHPPKTEQPPPSTMRGIQVKEYVSVRLPSLLILLFPTSPHTHLSNRSANRDLKTSA